MADYESGIERVFKTQAQAQINRNENLGYKNHHQHVKRAYEYAWVKKTLQIILMQKCR